MRLATLASGLALTISAGSPPALAQEGPEAPVVGLLDAIEEKRVDELGSFFCAEFADEASSLDVTAALAESLPAGIDTQQLLDALVLSVEGLETEVSEETAVTANVSVDATIAFGIEQEAATALMAAIFESLGLEPSDELLAGAVADMEAAVAGQSLGISEEVVVIRGAEGAWVICSPLDADDDGPGASHEPVDPAGPLRSGDPGLERPGRGGGEEDAEG